MKNLASDITESSRKVRATAICAFCGEHFEVRSLRGRVPRYCRASHRQRAYEARRLDRLRDPAEDAELAVPRVEATAPRGAASAGDVRSRILAAARFLMADQGLEGTTVRKIASRAGVAYGTVSYHFGSKERLLLEILRAEASTNIRGAQEAAQIEDAVSRRRSLREELRTRVKREPEMFKLRFELFALSMRRETYRRALASMLRRSREVTAETLERAGFAPGDGAFLAPVLKAAVDGFALQALVDSEFDHDAAHYALIKLLAIYRRARMARDA